jgi:UDP-3-O-[3-hydroxymyristoyl] N-acetylglucosamine deacetylase
MQETLKTPITFSGIGLHTGEHINVTVKPAAVDHGIVFYRTDIAAEGEAGEAIIPAQWDHVVISELCTLVTNEYGHTISTIEHLMSALAGCMIDNALIEIDGPEMPIMDGSSLKFTAAILQAGKVYQHKPKKTLRILERVEIEEDDKTASLSPSHIPVYSFGIDFPNTAIGRQDLTFEMLSEDSYAEHISDCRTFTRKQDVEFLRSKGLIKGGSLDNAIVVDADKIVNGPLRHHDEFVRHKILDAIGDVALCGHLMVGHYHSSKGGHALTNKLLRKLFDTPSAYRIDETNDAISQSKDIYAKNALKESA